MELWRSQHFKKFALNKGSDPELVKAAVDIARALQDKSPYCQPIFSLRHLAYSAGVKYNFLREVVERRASEKYRIFKIHKRDDSKTKPKRFRMICAPVPQLMKAQRWIVHNILRGAPTHDASVAYKAKSNIVDAASLHCGCSWLIKLDIVNFFESITEQSVYSVFYKMGYQPLVAFELARICTRKGEPTRTRNIIFKRWRTKHSAYTGINAYSGTDILGHLPQGAPTSPMLANLVMRDFDQAVETVADRFGMIYTRYADDLTLSINSQDFSRKKAQHLIFEIYKILRIFSFEPNITKTQIIPPSARRVVLGLLVDGPKPRLTKKFRNRLRLHLYHLSPKGEGPVKHAERNRFQSVFSLRDHINGLIAFAHLVEPAYAQYAWEKFNKVQWP